MWVGGKVNKVISALQGVLNNAGVSLTATWRLEQRAAALHIRELFHRYSIDAVLDVGANEGQFHNFLRQEVGYTGWVVSFEPAPAPLSVLRNRVAADPRWRLVDKALGPQSGAQPLHVAAHSTLSSFFPPRFDQTEFAYEGRQIVQTIEVEVVRLDDLLPGIAAELGFRRPFLKLDTQGYDLAVIQGANDSLSSIAALQIELSVVPLYQGTATYEETIASLNARGFRLSNLFPVAIDADLRLIEFDCVMIRPELHQFPCAARR